MASYRDLLSETKAEIDEIDAADARSRLDDGETVFVDVRERAEWDEGHIPGAVHIPRGSLESRIEGLLPDRARPLVVLLRRRQPLRVRGEDARRARLRATSSRSAAASRTGSATASRSRSRRPSRPRKRRRYCRHLLIPEVGEEGQAKLLDSRVLLIGAGGLGSPASLYLAAAGVGTLGIVDDDVVDESNLQRQIVHTTERLGEGKAESAKRTLEALNPDVSVKVYARAAYVRERRPHPRRGLGRDRGRRRQLPDALPR